MWIGPKNVLRTSEALGAAVHEGPGPGHGAQGPDYKGKVVVSRATSTHQDLWRLLCDCVDRCTTAPPQCTSPRPRGRRRSHETHAEPVPHRIPSFHIVPPPLGDEELVQVQERLSRRGLRSHSNPPPLWDHLGPRGGRRAEVANNVACRLNANLGSLILEAENRFGNLAQMSSSRPSNPH